MGGPHRTGLVRITTLTRLEIGFSARSGSDLRVGTQQPPLAAMPVEYLTPAIEERAAEVQVLLADRGLQAFRLGEVLQAVRPQFPQPRPVRQAALDQSAGGIQTNTCPPWPAAAIRAALFTSSPR